MFLADRAEHVAKVIRPALQRGETVLCDRFIDSTIAYQGFGLGLPVEQLMQLNDTATGGLVPNLTILLDIEPEIGLRRSQRKTIFERRSLAFHERVRSWLSVAGEQRPAQNQGRGRFSAS
jgi:dTMP kinase